MYVGSGGKLVVIANDVVTMSARLEGVSDIVFARNSIYTDEDGTLHGGLLNDDREFVVDAQPLNSGRFAFGEGSSEQDYKSAAGDVQILQAQDDFTGTVTVNKGMTLTLGNFGNDELDASFANASKITLEEGSDKIVAGCRIKVDLEEAQGEFWVTRAVHTLGPPHTMNLTIRRAD